MICVFNLPACQAQDANEGFVRAANAGELACVRLAGQVGGLNTLDFNRIQYIGEKTFL